MGSFTPGQGEQPSPVVPQFPRPVASPKAQQVEEGCENLREPVL